MPPLLLLVLPPELLLLLELLLLELLLELLLLPPQTPFVAPTATTHGSGEQQSALTEQLSPFAMQAAERLVHGLHNRRRQPERRLV